MESGKTSWKRYVMEGALIVFSVLFALLINKFWEDYQTANRKEVALESIRQELETNKEILEHWKERHFTIRQTLTDLIEGKNDSLFQVLRSYDYLNLGVITNEEALIDAILSNTAWESAKTSGIISEFDFNTIQKLTNVYTMQGIMTDRTVINFVEYYFDAGTHKMDELQPVLRQLQLRIWELTGQEVLLTYLYGEALELLGNEQTAPQ